MRTLLAYKRGEPRVCSMVRPPSPEEEDRRRLVRERKAVDPASITTSRRKKRAKTDRIDGEALVRALLAYKRGEPRFCSMVRPPSPEEEDRRRLVRERKALITERVRHSNRIKGLLFAQGISKYEPLRRDRRARLAALRTGDGRELPAHLKAQISRLFWAGSFWSAEP